MKKKYFKEFQGLRILIQTGSTLFNVPIYNVFFYLTYSLIIPGQFKIHHHVFYSVFNECIIFMLITYTLFYVFLIDSLSHMHTCYFVSILRKKIMSTLTLKRRKRTIVEKYEIIKYYESIKGEKQLKKKDI
jgi:hypothetical protein